MCKRIRRYIIAAVLGAVVGFGAQAATDFFFWDLNEPDRVYVVSHSKYPVHPNTRTFSQYFLGGNYSKYFDGWVKSYGPRLQNQARSVGVESMLLWWFMEREEQVGRAFLFGAFLAVSAVLAREHIQRNGLSGKKSTDVKAVSKESPEKSVPAALPDTKPIPSLSCESDGSTINVSKKEVVEQ